MRVPVTDTQQVIIEAVGDTPSENRLVREDHQYQATESLYELSQTPVTSVQNVKGEIHYDYTFDRSSLTTPFSYSSAFSGGLPTADPTQESPAFEATLTEFTSEQLQKVLSANGVAVETQSSVDDNQYAQQVFAIQHDNLDKLHTLSIRWDGYGDQYDGVDHHYGATLYIWNNGSNSWETIGQVTGNSIGTVQSTLTSNLSNYFVDDEKLYLLVAADTPADGVQAAQLWTDYVRVDMYVGQYVSGDHTQAADFPADSYEQTGDQVEWDEDEFLPTNATGFWVEYRTPLPRYDLVQIGLDGNIEVKKGTPSTSPVVPSTDDEHLQLAHVYVVGNLTIKNQSEAISGENGIIYDDRIFIWTGEEGVAAREDADTLLENLINRTKETSPDPNFVVSGLEVQPYPDAEGSNFVQITDGIFYCEGERITVSGLAPYEFNFDTLDLNTHRKDIITIDSDQSIHQYIGDPGTLQEAVDLPDFPSDEVPLAYIEVTGQMVQDQVVLGSSISNSQDGTDISEALVQRMDELEGDGVLYDDVSIAPASPRSRSIDLQVDSAGILYINGRRVEVVGESDAGEIQPMSAEQYDWEDDNSFHPFQSGLNQETKDGDFNVDSTLHKAGGYPLESVERIDGSAICDYHFRRPFGSQYTHQAWHLSYPDLSIDPTDIPGGTPAAATEFGDDGFDGSNMPSYDDGYNTYQNLMFSDGVRAEKEGSPTAGHYAQHIFKFRHIDNEGSPSNLNFIWHGQGHRRNADGTISYGAKIQVWNVDEGIWEDLADSDTDNEGISEDEMILSHEITSSVSDYIDGDGNVWLRAYCKLPAADSYGASIITDYVECQVTETNRLFVGNKIRNSDFEYGLDRPYDWEYLGDGTVSWITTEADSVVNQNCFQKNYPYLWHEFCDNDTIGDAYANDPRTRSLRISSNGSQNSRVRQRFNVNQDNSSVRPIRFSAWVKGNVDSEEGETPNCSIVLELWDTDNEQFYTETIELPVGEYEWTEVARDIIPSDPISYGRVTLRILGVNGWVAFDQVTLTEVPESHLVYNEEDEVTDVLDHDIEIDYQVNKDYIDWSTSGFSPTEGEAVYSAECLFWPIRIDSCQVDTGSNLTIYTGEEGQEDYGPEEQTLSHTIAEIVVRGDRPIVASDDGYNSYIRDKAVQEFTGEEGIEHRTDLDVLEESVGSTFFYGIVWGLIPTLSDDEKSVKVSPGEFRVRGTDYTLETFTSIAGTEEMDTGWYYVCIDVDDNGVPQLSFVSFSTGWPTDKVVIAKAYWHGSDYQSGSGLVFGQMDDLRHHHFLPHRIDDEKRGLDAGLYEDGVSIDLFDFRGSIGPAPPVLNEPLAGDQKLIITWSAVDDPTLVGYRVYRGTSRTGTYSPIATVESDTTTYTDYPIDNGTTYWYKVASISNEGFESDLSSLDDPDTNDYDQPQNGAALAVPPPQAPGSVSASGGDHHVSITWDAVSQTETGESITPACTYAIYRSCLEEGGSETGPWIRVNNQLVEGTSYVDSSLRNGYTFYYTVMAVREPNVGSEMSSAVSATTVSGGEPVPEDQAASPQLTATNGEAWSSAAELESADAIDNAVVVSPTTSGTISFVPPEVSPLSEGYDYSVDVGFLVDDASVEISRIMGGASLHENSIYDTYYSGEWPTPFDELSSLEDGNYYYEDLNLEQNGEWVSEEISGGHTLSYTPIEPGSCRFYPADDVETESDWVVEADTGDFCRRDDPMETDYDIFVRYQREKTREHSSSYPISSVVKIRNMTTGETLVEGEDYEVYGDHIYFTSLPKGRLRIIYALDLSRMSDDIWANVSVVDGESFTVNFNAPEDWQIDLEWSASNNGMVRVLTPDVTSYGYGDYGYQGYEPGFGTLSTEEATVNYVGDSLVEDNNWNSIHLNAMSEEYSGEQTLQLRVRGANTIAGLAEASWSSWSDVVSGSDTQVTVTAAGRYIEIQLKLIAHNDGGDWVSPYVGSVWAKAENTHLQWTTPTVDVSGNPITVTGFKLYARVMESTEVLIQEPSGNEYIYTSADTASFRVQAMVDGEGGAFSDEKINQPDFLTPAQINNISIGKNINGVKVSWDSVSNRVDDSNILLPEGYNIYRRASGETQWTLLNTSPVDASYYYDNTVEGGITYEYIVRTVDGRGIEAPRSSWVSTSVTLQEETIDPDYYIEDTFVNSQQAHEEYHDSNILRVSKSDSAEEHAIMVTQLNNNLRGDAIQTLLKLYIDDMDEENDLELRARVFIDPDTSDGTTYITTYHNWGQYQDLIDNHPDMVHEAGTVTITAGSSGWVDVDLGDSLRQWMFEYVSERPSYQDPAYYINIILSPVQSSGDSWAQFKSVDSTPDDYRPYLHLRCLEIDQSPNAPDNLFVKLDNPQKTTEHTWEGSYWSQTAREDRVMLSWEETDDENVICYEVYKSLGYGDMQVIKRVYGNTCSLPLDSEYAVYSVVAMGASDRRDREWSPSVEYDHSSDESNYVAVEYNQPQDIEATQDTYVDPSNPDTSFEEQDQLSIDTVDEDNRYALIQFDLDSVGIPDDATILSAESQVRPYDYDERMPVYVIDESWDAETTTYNNKPGHEDDIAAYLDKDTNRGLSCLLQRWHEGDVPNYGVAVFEWDSNAYIYSMESNYPPYLQVWYTRAVNNPNVGSLSASEETVIAISSLSASSAQNHEGYKELVENPQNNYFNPDIIPAPEALSATMEREDYEGVRVPDDGSSFEHQASNTSNIPVLVCKFDITEAFSWVSEASGSGDGLYPMSLSGLHAMIEEPSKFNPIKRMRAVWRGYCDANDPSSSEKHVARVFVWNWMKQRWEHGEQQDGFTFERSLQKCCMDVRSTEGTMEQYINEDNEVYIAIMPTRLNQLLDLKLVTDYVGLMVCFGVNEVGGQFVIDDGETEKLVGINSGVVGQVGEASELNVAIGEAFCRDANNATFTQPPAVIAQARRQDNGEIVNISVEASPDMPRNAFLVTIEDAINTESTPVVISWTATGR
jgi:fibronectin type 3 domain-containing protein